MNRLCSSHAKGTASVLKQEYINMFSPAVGLLTSLCPSLIHNIRALDSYSNVKINLSKFTREFFFQRLDENKRRIGPLQITNSRSNVAYWLSHQQLGMLLGLAYLNTLRSLTNHDIDEHLKKNGIECNHVNGKWSGISLQRYRNIIHLLSDDIQASYHSQPSLWNGFTIPIYLRFIWEKSSSKYDLLSFLIALENTLQKDILLDDYHALRNSHSSVTQSWCQLQFHTDEMTNYDLMTAINSFVSDTNNASKGEYLEILAAYLGYEKSFKSAIRLGKYRIDDGPIKPDCVEVVIREICDSIFYDKATDSVCDISLFPSSVHPKLIRFYGDLQAGVIDDIPIRQKLKNARRGLQPTDNGSRADLTPVIEEMNSLELILFNQDVNNTTASNAWFRLCNLLEYSSDITLHEHQTKRFDTHLSFEYLSETSSGVPYELSPTVSNLLKILGLLLEQKEWHHIHDLKRFYYQWKSTLSQYCKHGSDLINATHHIRSFRAPFSDTEKIFRDQICIQFLDKNYQIEIELEKAHNLASVKHRQLLSTNKHLIAFCQIVSNYWFQYFSTVSLSDMDMGIHDLIKRDGYHSSVIQSPVKPKDLSHAMILFLITSLLLHDQYLNLFYPLRPTHAYNDPMALSGPIHIGMHDLILLILSSRYGEERSSVHTIYENGGTVSVSDATLYQSEMAHNKYESHKLSLHHLWLIQQYYDQYLYRPLHGDDGQLLFTLYIFILNEIDTDIPLHSLYIVLKKSPLTNLSKSSSTNLQIISQILRMKKIQNSTVLYDLIFLPINNLTNLQTLLNKLFLDYNEISFLSRFRLFFEKLF